jgi:cysteine-rich repeat protein
MGHRAVQYVVSVLVLTLVYPAVGWGAVPKKQAACIKNMNKSGIKVAQAQGAQQLSCVRRKLKGLLVGTIDDCITADDHELVEIVSDDTEDAEDSCAAPLPSFGFTGATTTNAVAIGQERALFRTIFSTPADPAFAPGEKCQYEALKRTQVTLRTALKLFLLCKKNGLKNGTITNAATLSSCVGSDPHGILQKSAQNIERGIRGCSGALTDDFPGCYAGTTAAVAQCLGTAAKCRACLMEKKMDDVPAQCDVIDDGVLNGSCPQCGNGVVEAGEQCDDGGNSATCDADCTFAVCGDGFRNPVAGEQCDDGNTQNGDCCDSVCQFEPQGTPCNDNNICTSVPAPADPNKPDACDGAGTCDGPAAPVDSGICLVPRTRGSSLFFKENGAKDKLVFKWKTSTPATTFDDPRNVAYTLCLYQSDGSSTAKLARVRLQKTATLWRDLGVSGYKYKDKRRRPDGVKTATLKPGQSSTNNVKLVAKGRRFVAPPLPLDGSISEVVAQLRHPGTGDCYEARYHLKFKRNTEIRFKGVSD